MGFGGSENENCRSVCKRFSLAWLSWFFRGELNIFSKQRTIDSLRETAEGPSAEKKRLRKNGRTTLKTPLQTGFQKYQKLI